MRETFKRDLQAEACSTRLRRFNVAAGLSGHGSSDGLAAGKQKTGGKILAIPHNGNLSSGLMFDDVTFGNKKPIDRNYPERRMKWEPV